MIFCSAFEAGFWLRHGRPWFALFWILFAFIWSIPIWL
jgi:hypothetical protein